MIERGQGHVAFVSSLVGLSHGRMQHGLGHLHAGPCG
ncbi:MAG: hypothetical protein P8017_16930 [Deltaproteobacteria bacterium]